MFHRFNGFRDLALALVLGFRAACVAEGPPSHDELVPQWPREHGEAVVCLWGEDKLAAVSISIDDNNAPDIPFWQDLATEFDWRFTWFVIVHPYMRDVYSGETGSNTGYFGTGEEFRDLARQGHEIGLHGSCKEMNHLDREAYRDHLKKSREYLIATTGAPVLTYAYPCGEVGNESDPKAYYELVQEWAIAARGTQGGATPAHRVDYLNTQSMGPVGLVPEASTRKRLGRLANPNRPPPYSSYRGWAVYLYHGLKGEEKRQQVRAALQHLKTHEDLYWVQPFGTVAKYARQRDAAVLATLQSDHPDEIVLKLTDGLPDEIFDVPLTVKVRTEGWQQARVTRNGREVPATRISLAGKSYILFNMVPDRGTVKLIRGGLPSKAVP